MELILPGHCGSLLPALHLLLPPVYMEASVDNVFASLMRAPQRRRGQWRVKATDDMFSGTAARRTEISAAVAESITTAYRVVTFHH